MSIVTSPLLTLGCPNFPATKNGTDVPLIGTGSVTLLENAPVVPLRNTTAPPPAADTPVTFKLTVGAGAPIDGLVWIPYRCSGGPVHNMECYGNQTQYTDRGQREPASESV